MAAQANFTYDQAFDFLDKKNSNQVFLNSDMTGKSGSIPAHKGQDSGPENRAFVTDIADDLLHPLDEYRYPSCSSGQDDPFSFDGFELHSNGDSRTLDPRFEALNTSLDLLPEIQTENSSLDLASDLLAAEWSMPGEGTLTDTPSSNAVPITPGNRYQPTLDPTECSTPASLSACNGFHDHTIGSDSSFDMENQRWHATLSRSRAADRYFLYGVLTTKIFCRPSCASRRPSRKHVRFFSFPGAIEAAEQAMFRPCKRCRPEKIGTGNNGVLAISRVLRKIIAETFEKRSEVEEEGLKLESLAKSAGLSIFHFHRLFKATTQVTPADFITACHALALQDALCTFSTRGNERDPSAVQISPRWSERTVRKALGGLGPEEYASGAKRASVEYCCVSAPVGNLEVAYSRDGKSSSVTVHAVVLLQDSCLPISNRFWAARKSEQHTQSLQQCIRELDEKCQDRDVELAADVLRVLWRARLWLTLTHDNILR